MISTATSRHSRTRHRHRRFRPGRNQRPARGARLAIRPPTATCGRRCRSSKRSGGSQPGGLGAARRVPASARPVQGRPRDAQVGRWRRTGALLPGPAPTCCATAGAFDKACESFEAAQQGGLRRHRVRRGDRRGARGRPAGSTKPGRMLERLAEAASASADYWAVQGAMLADAGAARRRHAAALEKAAGDRSGPPTALFVMGVHQRPARQRRRGQGLLRAVAQAVSGAPSVP